MALRQQIEHIKIKYPELHQKLRVDIYTNATIPQELLGIEHVEIKPAIGKALFDALNQADYSLILLSDAKRNEATTKFMEFIAMRKPMIVVAPEGKITSFVNQEKIGFALDFNSVSSLGEYLHNPGPFNDAFDITAYSLQEVSNRLCSFLK